MSAQNTTGQPTGGRPTLGEIKPGDLVFIRYAPNSMRYHKTSEQYIPARITKAARVWIELRADEDALRFMSWRMRRDTQSESGQHSGSNASFVTVEQRAWDERLRDAHAFLKSQGIRIERYVIGSGNVGNINSGAPWWGREIELADLIRREIGATP